MRVVRHRVQPLRPALSDVVLVGGDRELVRAHRICIPPHALIDVGRHVHHVAGGRHQRQQRICRLLRLLGSNALHQVDVHVDRAGMPGFLAITCSVSATISAMPSCGVPSPCQYPHGRRSITDSTYSIVASRSCG